MLVIKILKLLSVDLEKANTKGANLKCKDTWLYKNAHGFLMIDFCCPPHTYRYVI